MAKLFSDLPEALENSVEIAKRLNLEIRLGTASLLAFPVPTARARRIFSARSRGAAWTARSRCRSQRPPAGISREDYDSRLARELGRDLPDGFRGVLPHRGGLHPLGAGETASR